MNGSDKYPVIKGKINLYKEACIDTWTQEHWWCDICGEGYDAGVEEAIVISLRKGQGEGPSESNFCAHIECFAAVSSRVEDLLDERGLSDLIEKGM